ncbi:MAG: sugar phosphate nucleotidyltransferase [Magnetococcus sp. DMHC-1]|nr:NTP transferase domain-containing protein [Magnetococcales bacterium]
MQDSHCLKDVTVAVLAGGLGTRVQGILHQTPKLLAPLAGRPFLDYLLEWVTVFGAQRLVLCLGHRAVAIQDYLACHPPTDSLELFSVIEPQPLGTAGALRFAMPLLQDRRILLINGDTFVGADLCQFHAAHLTMGMMATLLCTRVPDVSRYGSVDIGTDHRIRRFLEKDPNHHGPGTIYAGLILMEPSMLRHIAGHTGASLEQNILNSLPSGSLAAMVGAYPFIDFGTPDSFEQAQIFFGNWSTYLS